MLYKGVLIARASGRLDGVVFSHNAGGDYIRDLGNPNPNPPTDEQLAMRQAMAECVQAWKDLTPLQRQMWAEYSEANPRPGRSGVIRPAGGLPEFTRHTIHRRQANIRYGAALDLTSEPPDVDGGWPTQFPTFSIGNGDDYLAIHWPATNNWNLNDQAVLLVYQSEPQEDTINWFRSPMTLLNPCTDSTPGTDVLVNMTSQAYVGQRVFFKFILSLTHAQALPPWYVHVDVTP